MSEARKLCGEFLSGSLKSPYAFRNLIALLLGVSVQKDIHADPPLLQKTLQSKGGSPSFVISGREGTPIRLNDGHFLGLYISLYIEPRTKSGVPARLKVNKATYTYQLDESGKRWIARYDYLRKPDDPHAGSHLHVNGTLAHPECLPDDTCLDRIHFPTHRISIEGIIRLLVEQFKIPTNEPTMWRPVLAETEGVFMGIAHQNHSGPAK